MRGYREQTQGRREVVPVGRLRIALSALETADGPIGARRLAEIFRADSEDIAEATAGRLLRSLDEMGLTTMIGMDGRQLTTRGRETLRRLRWEDEFSEGSARVMAAASMDDLGALLDVLHTRRAVEGSAAHLAALRGSETELQEIAAAASAHLGCLHESRRVQKSADFHWLVVQASHNDMLVAIAGLLFGIQSRKLLKLLDDILNERQHRGDGDQLFARANDHLAVANALLARDAERAEALMREHVDHMIRSIEHCLSEERTRRASSEPIAQKPLATRL